MSKLVAYLGVDGRCSNLPVSVVVSTVVAGGPVAACHQGISMKKRRQPCYRERKDDEGVFQGVTL